MGDRYFDLANFAVNNELDDAAAGGAARAPTSASRRTSGGSATLRLMRFMSDFREAMWGVVQAVVSELDFDFVGYHVKALRPPARDRGPTRASPAGSRRRVAGALTNRRTAPAA